MVENIFAAYLQLNQVIVSQAAQRICSVQVCWYTGHVSQVTGHMYRSMLYRCDGKVLKISRFSLAKNSIIG